MNSTNPDFDWHARGVHVALTPSGAIIWGTFADTAYSARSELVRQVNLPWSVMRGKGYAIRTYELADPVVPDPTDEFAGMPSEAYFGLMTPAPVDVSPAPPPRCWRGQPCDCTSYCGDDKT